MGGGEPIRVCRDTWLITQLTPAAVLGALFFNSAVITASEPIVVDTGTPVNRQGWLDQLGSVLDPADVRWIFISHDDIDHVGNLPALLEMCPKATLLTSWMAAGRMLTVGGLTLPLRRIRLLNDGEAVDVGDRRLRALVPPAFDNSATLGLFDPSNGFYWAADCFCAPVPYFVPEADDVPAAQWRRGFLDLHRLLSPWHTMLDHRRFAAVVDRVQQLPITVAAGAHGPIVRDSRLADAFRMLRELPHLGALAQFSDNHLQSWPTATTNTQSSGPADDHRQVRKTQRCRESRDALQRLT